MFGRLSRTDESVTQILYSMAQQSPQTFLTQILLCLFNFCIFLSFLGGVAVVTDFAPPL